MGLLNIKLTGNIHEDIDKVNDAVQYVQALSEGLFDEEIAQNNENKDHFAVFSHIMDLKECMKKAVNIMQRMKWAEDRYWLGPFADRKDM